MNCTLGDNKKQSCASEIDQYLPQALQTLLKIEQLAQARSQQIKESVERGETTYEAVKRERGLI